MSFEYDNANGNFIELEPISMSLVQNYNYSWMFCPWQCDNEISRKHI